MPLDLDAPQWEACKICQGDHWTKDHDAELADLESELVESIAAEIHAECDLGRLPDEDNRCREAARRIIALVRSA